jgi:hypothetical protein
MAAISSLLEFKTAPEVVIPSAGRSMTIARA